MGTFWKALKILHDSLKNDFAKLIFNENELVKEL